MSSPEQPEAMLELTINGEVVYAHRNNTALFTFWGRQMIEGCDTDISIFDHVFVAKAENDGPGGGFIGSYVHKHDPDNPEAYEAVSDWVAAQKWPQHLNMNMVQQCDIDAFNRRMCGDNHDVVPEAWEGE